MVHAESGATRPSKNFPLARDGKPGHVYTPRRARAPWGRISRTFPGIPGQQIHDERARRPTTPLNAPAPRARALGGDWHGMAKRRLEGPNIWDVL